MVLLVEPLKADLKISDTQIGVLQGPAFGIFYVALGLPLGWLADRVHRVRLIASGIFLWSVMTMACGLANSFPSLCLARLGVGVGEAALVPAAISLLADLFSARERALPMSVFTGGVSLGGGLALILGGAFITYAHHGVVGFPLIGPWLAARRVWQTVFILAGLVGLPVAFFVLLLTEPEREHPLAEIATTGQSDAVDQPDWRLLGPMYAGAALLYIFPMALGAWGPTLFIRNFHWAASAVGMRLGLLNIGCALVGNTASGLVANWFTARGRSNSLILTMIFGASLLAPIGVLGPLAPTGALTVAGLAVIHITTAICFGVATATFVTVAPGRLRGRIVALYLLFGNLMGQCLGPLSVGLILDHGFHDSSKLGEALALVSVLTVAPGALFLASVRRRYASRVLLTGAWNALNSKERL